MRFQSPIRTELRAPCSQLGYHQVLARLPVVFAIDLPPWLTHWLRWFDMDWMRITLPQPACIGTYASRLLLHSLLPLALATLVALCSVASVALPSLGLWRGQPTPCKGGALRLALLRSLPFLLFLLFAFVPNVSSHIFASYSCDRYGNGPSEQIYYLHTDAAIRQPRPPLPACI